MTYIIIAIDLIIAVIAFALCKMSGDNDRQEEKIYNEYIAKRNNKTDVLSELERQSVERFKAKLKELNIKEIGDET